MSDLRLQFATYDRLLPRPIVTAHGSYARRQGILCKLSDSTGLAGFGDAAPLPGFSHESYDDTLQVMCQLTADLSGNNALNVPQSAQQLPAAMAFFGDAISKFPALRFALESALADLSSRRTGVPLAQWLSATAANAISINAMIDGSESADDLTVKAQERFAAVNEEFFNFTGRVQKKSYEPLDVFPGNDLARVLIDKAVFAAQRASRVDRNLKPPDFLVGGRAFGQ